MTHTPEPEYVDDGSPAFRETVTAMELLDRTESSRLHACLVACDGIPTDKLRPGIVKELIDAARVSQSDGDVDEIWTATDRLDALLRELGSE